MGEPSSPVDFLRRAFPGIQLNEADEMNSAGVVCEYPAGTILCHEGTIESTFYIILAGEVKVVKRTMTSQERFITNLGIGDFFGEMALIHHAPRSASVITTTMTRVMEIQKDDFQLLLERSNAVSLIMIREVARRLRENDRLAIEDLRLRASEMAEAFEQLANQDLARRSYLNRTVKMLRSPLITATGCVQALSQGEQAGSDPIFAGTIIKTLRELIAAMNEILFLQEMDMILPEFVPVDLAGLVNLVVDENRAKADMRRVKVQIQANPGLAPVSGDPYALKQAVGAVLDNAIKFSHPGGEVSISFQTIGNELALRIADRGVGLSPETQKRIFERFYHTDRAGDEPNNGAGLGLPLAQAILIKHGGWIDVATRPGAGSTFSLRLPLQASA